MPDVRTVDSGIRVDHVDFEGRAKSGYNAIFNEDSGDYNGHGTHVAGTVGGATWGVAKNVDLSAVKVLDGEGAGSTGKDSSVFRRLVGL